MSQKPTIEKSQITIISFYAPNQKSEYKPKTTSTTNFTQQHS